MTVSSTNRRSGPYSGNGVTTSFAYGFRILDGSHVRVVRTIAGEDATVDPLEYTVSGVGNQVGGSITFTIAPPVGQSITIIRSAPFTQQVDLENQGAYYAETIEEALDLATMRDQQMQEELDRSLKIAVGVEASELDNLVIAVRTVSDNIDDINTVAGVSGDVSIAAGVAGDISVVADNVADVTWLSDVYYGPAASDPATRRDGSALVSGDFYFNTTTDLVRVWDGGAWRSSVKAAGVSTYRYVATAAQTVFTGADAVGQILYVDDGSLLVTLNGVALIEGVDYTVTDGGDSVTLTTGATLDDDLVILSFDQLDFARTILDMTALRDETIAAASGAVPFADRAGFIAGDIPVAVTRASFFVGGNTYAVVRDAAGPIVQTNGQRWRPDGGVTPQHFGAVGDGVADDTAAVQAAIDGAVATNSVLFWKTSYALTDKLNIPAALMMRSERRAALIAQGSVPTAIELLPGNATGRNELPIIQNFNGKALIVRSNLGRYFVPQILGCNTAVQFLADGSNVLDSIVHVEAISTCTRGVEFNATAASRVIQGCGLEYNFITVTKYPVVFDGTPCFWDGLFARGEAIDLTASEADGVVLHNVSGGMIPRFTLHVRSWIGGDGFSTSPFAKIASGVWNAAELDMVNAFNFNQNNMTANTLQASTVKTRGMNLTPRAMSQTAGLANYNGGVSDSATHLALSGTTSTDWPVNGVKDFYAYNIWADRNFDVWQLTPRGTITGVVVGFVLDEDAAEPGRLRIRLVNLGGSNLVAPQTFSLTLHRV